jgi:hypothetical protein
MKIISLLNVAMDLLFFFLFKCDLNFEKYPISHLQSDARLNVIDQSLIFFGIFNSIRNSTKNQICKKINDE